MPSELKNEGLSPIQKAQKAAKEKRDATKALPVQEAPAAPEPEKELPKMEFAGSLQEYCLAAKNLGKRASFPNMDMSGTDISGQELPSIVLKGCDLSGVTAVGTCLQGANLEKANVKGMLVHGADLRFSILPKDFKNEALWDEATMFHEVTYV
jgi:uncharacterized protein YjbI with pentapeptide repeats